MSKLQVPLVDAVYYKDGDDALKNHEDKRADSALRKSFDASSTAIRAASTVSILSRAAFTWARDLIQEVPKGNIKLRQGINKLLKVLAFSSDASLDIMQLITRAQAASVPVRRQSWLKNWTVDTKSKQNLTMAPFSGQKLFGDALQPVLI